MKTQLVLLLSIVLLSSSVIAQEVDIYYQIITKSNNKVLTARSNKQESGIFVRSNENSLQQVFKFIPTDEEDDYFFIQSALGRFLHVYKNNSNPRAEVRLLDFSNKDNFKWKLVEAEGGHFYVKNKLGTSLDIKGGNAESISAWMNNQNVEKWRIKKLGENKWYEKNKVQIKSSMNDNLLLTVRKNENRSGIYVDNQKSSPKQTFHFIPTGDGYYYIKNDLGLYVHVYENKKSLEAEVRLWDYDRKDGFKWKLEATSGSFFIKSKNGTYLEVKGGRNEPNTSVWMYSRNGSNAQQWKLTRWLDRNFTSFDPKRHGFKFSNSFSSNNRDISFIKMQGMCGGMIYAAMDHYVHNVPIPSNESVPAELSPLEEYIYERHMNSWEGNAAKWAEFAGTNVASARDREFFYWGLEGRLYDLKRRIDSGKPVILGLNTTTYNPLQNHVVLAIGYDLNGYRGKKEKDRNKGKVIIYVYDPNKPNKVMALKPRVKYNNYDYHSATSLGDGTYKIGRKVADKQWRTYFVDDNYRAVRPGRF
ncbi:RICIN domain-containing protein [Tunicatimonas pelagia]|uniref:RICIN domain-containing protein n=1 Tax=Tunicatimonas pelagia TaxID=931531 RepID=UPI002665C8A1|nr:RICIN domain-containing protein [Tunicatimonas pelagia]WKN42933.1 RICIN domain-containing protein [Tunicatimonas pelagia]